jgi:hypothetical protein
MQSKIENKTSSQEKAEAMLRRLMDAAGAKNESALAAAIGISHQAVYNAKKKGVIPPAWVYTIAVGFGVSTDWLFFGHRECDEEGHFEAVGMHESSGLPSRAADTTPHAGPAGKNMLGIGGGIKEIPVTGLAQCGLQGWFNTGPVALSCPVSAEEATPNMFAVIALGTSMQPEGIKAGYVVVCDPDKPRAKGDAVFIERHDGAAGIKLYTGEDAEWLDLQGWLEPKKDGSQKSYAERLLKSAVQRIAVVVLVKRRA